MTSRNESEVIILRERTPTDHEINEAFEAYMDREWGDNCEEDGGIHWRDWEEETQFICREVFKAGVKHE